MGITELIIIGSVVLLLLVVGFVVIWAVARRYHHQAGPPTEAGRETELLQTELHDKAREDLAVAIRENANFIQQDVRRSTSELNGYMQQEVTRALDEEISKFAESTDKLESVASSSIVRMQSLLNERYIQLSARVDEESANEKDRIIAEFQNNMTEVVSYYVTQALGSHLDVGAQLDYVISELEANKQAIIEDIKHA